MYVYPFNKQGACCTFIPTSVVPQLLITEHFTISLPLKKKKKCYSSRGNNKRKTIYCSIQVLSRSNLRITTKYKVRYNGHYKKKNNKNKEYKVI